MTNDDFIAPFESSMGGYFMGIDPVPGTVGQYVFHFRQVGSRRVRHVMVTDASMAGLVASELRDGCDVLMRIANAQWTGGPDAA